MSLFPLFKRWEVASLLFILLCSASVFLGPRAVAAEGIAPCPCVMDPRAGPLYCPVMVCTDVTNGFPTKGHCVTPGICHGETGGGKGLDAGLQALGQVLGQLMQKLMQPSPPSSGSPPSAPAGSGASGCVNGTFFQTSDVSRLSDPCAQYVGATSDSGGTGTSVDLSGQLLNSLGDQSGVDLSSALLGNTNSNTNTNATGSIPTGSTVSVPQGVVGLVPTLGVSGDIRLLDNGATIVAGSRSEQQNSEIAGFYGAGSFGGQPQSLVGQWCQARPWAGNFLSFIVPPTFFDSLCTWRGYQVGTPPPPQQQTPSLQQQVIPAAQSATTSAPATPVGSTVAPKVDIWAVPAAVPLGARTTIFWNTQGVTNCTETSPDGSFNQSSLSGGAATVPLTGATTFSISCFAPDNSHVTGYVVVNLSI